MQRLLCILSGMNAGGAETFLMKNYRALDKKNYQMDFCINEKEKCFYEDEIDSLGGKIYRIPSKSENLSEFRRQLFSIVQDNGYKCVLRITSNAAGFMDLMIAKKAGATICCARSSNSSDGGKLKSLCANRIGRLLYGKYVDVKIAPSDLAAKYTFGKKAYKQGKVKILHNGLDLNVFKYDEQARQRLRQEFGVSDKTFVVGHIGRFAEQKNHRFLIDVFAEIKKKQEDAMLILVGIGPLTDEIHRKVSELNLEKSVRFFGTRKDIPQLLSAMDIFVFPSFYEGMPNTLIEAQATGLPCVISDSITIEADVSGIVKRMSLSDSAAEWSNTILSTDVRSRKETHSILRSKGYDIASVISEFASLVFQGE